LFITVGKLSIKVTLLIPYTFDTLVTGMLYSNTIFSIVTMEDISMLNTMDTMFSSFSRGDRLLLDLSPTMLTSCQRSPHSTPNNCGSLVRPSPSLLSAHHSFISLILYLRRSSSYTKALSQWRVWRVVLFSRQRCNCSIQRRVISSRLMVSVRPGPAHALSHVLPVTPLFDQVDPLQQGCADVAASMTSCRDTRSTVASWRKIRCKLFLT